MKLYGKIIQLMLQKNINILIVVNKVCGNWGLNNDSWLVLSELGMFGDVVVEQAGVTNVIKAQTLETIAGVCDGSGVVEGTSGSYTLENVTSSQEIGTGTRDIITGSSINYKPPHGTNMLFITLHLLFRGDVDSGGGEWYQWRLLHCL